MAEARHSPGPWVVRDGGYLRIEDADGEAVAHATDHWSGHGMDNARLIASAPTLAAQLAEAVAILRRLDLCDDPDTLTGIENDAADLVARVDGAKSVDR